MNYRLIVVLGWAAATTLAASSASVAQAPASGTPPMHMHKAEMDHSKMADPEVAAEFKTEAATLREKAASHRQLGKSYVARSGGKTDYAQIGKHCEKLASFYEDAAKGADAVSSGLSKP